MHKRLPVLAVLLLFAVSARSGEYASREVAVESPGVAAPVVGGAVDSGGGSLSGPGAPATNLRSFSPRARFRTAARLRDLQDSVLGAASGKEAQDGLFEHTARAGNGVSSPRRGEDQGKALKAEFAAQQKTLGDKLRDAWTRLRDRLPSVGRRDDGSTPDLLKERVWVSVKAASREERTRAAELGVSIEEVYGDHIEGVAHRGALARLNEAGLKVLSAEPLGQKFSPENFPIQDGVYHDYGELTAELRELAAKNPETVSLFSIGKSLQGQDIWCVRLNTTEKGTAPSKKPGVVFMGNHHAREHLSVEMPLMLAKNLAAAGDAATRKLLNERDVYIIPMVNPDGAEYDVYNRDVDGKAPRRPRDGYQMWRKNLRRNADGSYGVDLNRNYGYMWNTGGSSDSGRDETYHGPSAFSEPETQAVRDFVLARPNLRVLLSYHTFSELILYPWGHKYDPIEDKDDMQAHKIMAETMAKWNGYTPEQSSDLYIASGDTTDWAYGVSKDLPRERRLFSFTFELTPKSMWDGGFYPGPGVIQSTFDKNLPPALYLIGLADDPYKVLPKSSAGATR